jgi:protease-4
LTGSIGAFAGHFGLDGLYEKLGVNVETVKRGRYADFLETSRAMSTEERDKLAALLWSFYHDDFVAKVAEGRKLDPAAVDAAGRGRVWTGAQAQPLHLVDRLGGFDEAVAALRERAGLTGEDIEIVVLPRPGLRSLQEMFSRKPWAKASLELEALAAARRLAEPAVYALMPFRLEFH